MTVAFACWENRIAPVFDTAETLVILDDPSNPDKRRMASMPPDEPVFNRQMRLGKLNVQTLICGAISRHLFNQLSLEGIRIIPFISGDLDQVIRAWCSGCLDQAAFGMPGCHGRHRGRGGGKGRRGDGFNTGPGGECICPACGYREPHQPGIPCVERRCQHCRTLMVRR